MISLFSLNEPDNKPHTKTRLNLKDPGLWIILAAVVLIIASAAIYPQSAAACVSKTIIPADVKLFEMEIKDYAMERYIADFESDGNMQYHWITSAVEFYSYYLSISQHFKNNEEVSTAFRKYDSEFFQTNSLMIVTLRSDSNITCSYNGDYKTKSQKGSSANEEVASSSYEFAYEKSSPAFSLEYLWRKNESSKTGQSNWWLSFVEFDNGDFNIDPSMISPVVISGYNSGTAAVSEPSVTSAPSETSTVLELPENEINPNPIPADIALFEMDIYDSDDLYVTDFEANGEIQYNWITDTEQMKTYTQTLEQHFSVWGYLSDALEKYDAEFFETGILMPVILRSENNVSCFYSGNSAKDYPPFPYAKNYGSIQSYMFTLGASSVFNLEFSRLKNDTDYYENHSDWWIALVEFQKSDFQGLPPQSQPTLAVHSNRGNTDQVALRYAEVRYDKLNEFCIDTYHIIGFEDQVKLLLDAQGKILFYGSEFQIMPDIICVREIDGWHIYNKSTLLPASDKAYTEIQTEDCPNYDADIQRYAAKRNGKLALIDNYGHELTDAVYDEIYLNTYDNEPSAISVLQNGKYGAISCDGKVLVPSQYDFLTADFGTHIYIYQNNQWAVITLDSDMNASEPNWSVVLPKSILQIYTLFSQPFYNMNESETKICELFVDTYGFDMLASDTGEISDMYMAMFATMYMPNYDEENGHSKAEYDAVTMKYFGRTLTDYTGNGELEFIPGTDRLIPTGWGVEFSPNIVA